MTSSHNLPKDLVTYVRELERRISILEKTGRVVSSGSNNAGAIAFYGQDGTTPLFQIGDQVLGDRGVTINHDDGSKAIVVRRQFMGDTFQTLQFWDRGGHIIGGENYLADGIRTPFIPITLLPVTSPMEASTASASFVALFTAEFLRMNATCRLLFLARCSDGTTSGEVQIFNGDTGLALTAFFGAPVNPVAIPLGTTVNTEFDTNSVGDHFLPNPFEAITRLEIRARTTAGVGTLTIRPLFFTQGPA